MAVAGQIERVSQDGARFLEVRVRGGELLLDAAELTADAFLLGLEEVDRDGAGVVGIEELLPLGGQFDTVLVERLPLTRGGGLEGVEVFEDQVLNAVTQLGGERDGAVLVFDEFLDGLGVHGLSLAGRGLALAAGAGQVGVGGAPAVLGVDNHQPGATVAAVEAAAQVVQVPSLVHGGIVVGGEQVLGLLPGLRIDERLMSTGVDDAFVVDLALVVRVLEHLVQRGDRQRLARPLRGRSGGEAAVGELVEQDRE